MKEKLQLLWHEEIRNRINIQNIITNILFGGENIRKEGTFLEREERAEKELHKQLKRLGWTDKDILILLQQYGDIVKEVYFDMGLRIGICLEVELILKENGM